MSIAALTARARRPSTVVATSSVPVPVPGVEERAAPPPRGLSTAADLIAAIERPEQKMEVVAPEPVPARAAEARRPEPIASRPQPVPPAPPLRPDDGARLPEAPLAVPVVPVAGPAPAARPAPPPAEPVRPQPPAEEEPPATAAAGARHPDAEQLRIEPRPEMARRPVPEPVGPRERLASTLPALLERARRAPAEPAEPARVVAQERPAEAPAQVPARPEPVERAGPPPAPAGPPERHAVPPVTIGEIHIHEAVPAAAPADPLALLAPYGGGLTARRNSSAGAR